MKRIFSRVSYRLTLLIVLSCSIWSFAASRAALREGTIFATYIRLAVLNVRVLDKNTGQPLQDLRAEDFQVTDDGIPTKILFFTRAPRPDVEPIALWLVTGCVQKDKRGKQRGRQVNAAEFFEPALKELNPEDMVGVAHWCAEKNIAEMDLEPTKDRSAPVVALNTVLGQNVVESRRQDGGEAVQKVLQLVHSVTPSSSHPPFTVVVFFDSNATYASEAEAAQLARDVLTHTSLVVDEIEEGTVSSSKLKSANRISLLHYLSHETGGQVHSVSEHTAGEALQKIVAGLQSRYVLAIYPPPGYGKWHTLRVELAAAVMQRNAGVVLSYRSGYRMPAPAEYNPVIEKPTDTGQVLDSSLSHGLESDVLESDIPFDAEGATYEGPPLARFDLKLAGETLSWAAQPDGDDRSEITVVTALFSMQGEIIQKKLQHYEIVRPRTDAWTARKQAIEFSTFSEIPANADRVRILVRDDVSGKMGILNLSIQTILKAPKLRAIIAEKRSTGASQVGIPGTASVGPEELEHALEDIRR
jgi:hypothetical protein